MLRMIFFTFFVKKKIAVDNTRTNNTSSISLPLNQVIALAQTHGISRVEGLYGKGQLMDEKTLINANVIPVHDGYAPLAQGYDGDGVVIGVLDDGIDYHHPDFQNAD